jgi:F0F1-type ATP synthase delta subunit
MSSSNVINIFGEEVFSIDNALNAVLNVLEKEIGKPLDTLNNTERMNAFRRLLEMGAFSLRYAVPVISEEMAISRTAVYNALNKLGYVYERNDIDVLYPIFLQLADRKKEVTHDDLVEIATAYTK